MQQENENLPALAPSEKILAGLSDRYAHATRLVAAGEETINAERLKLDDCAKGFPPAGHNVMEWNVDRVDALSSQYDRISVAYRLQCQNISLLAVRLKEMNRGIADLQETLRDDS